MILGWLLLFCHTDMSAVNHCLTQPVIDYKTCQYVGNNLTSMTRLGYYRCLRVSKG